jgi:Ca2+:H+ antiporter
MDGEPNRDCRRCYFRQTPALNDDFFVDAVRPYCWFAAVMLFFSYIIGLLFTLRTHAALIWTTDGDEKRPTHVPTAEVSPTDTRHHSTANGPQLLATPSPSYIPGNSVRDSALYKRILGQSLKQVGIYGPDSDRTWEQTSSHKSPSLTQSQELNQKRSDACETPHVVPPKNKSGENGFVNIPGMPTLSEAENHHLATYVAEVAATAAAVAARDATKVPRRASFQAQHSYQGGKTSRPQSIRQGHAVEVPPPAPGAEPGAHAIGEGGGGHDAPNWSRTKSSVILCAATVAYALVAEVLVNTVDVVLQSVDIDEKFLGITLFALVPNTTEFLNAISFAMNGNIALSMEIGSAYALQVCLLQIPALVLFSAVHGRWIDPGDLLDHTFSLIFPQFDMVTVILCVFLLSYMYSEGKSNYFKGGILILTYLVVIMGFYYSGYTRFDMMGVDPTDTLAIMSSPKMSSMPASRQYHASHREL